MNKVIAFYYFYTPFYIEGRENLDTLTIPQTYINKAIKSDYSKDYLKFLEISDCKVLFFPVKSVKDVFSFTISPLVIEKFFYDVGKNLIKIPYIEDNEALAGKSVSINNQHLVLEDISFKLKNNLEFLEKIYSILPKNLKKEVNKGKLAVISDKRFKYFLKINREISILTNKIIYKNLIPSETIFYNLITLKDYRTDLDKIKRFLDGKIIQIGKDKTLGKGFTKVFIREL